MSVTDPANFVGVNKKTYRLNMGNAEAQPIQWINETLKIDNYYVSANDIKVYADPLSTGANKWKLSKLYYQYTYSSWTY